MRPAAGIKTGPPHTFTVAQQLTRTPGSIINKQKAPQSKRAVARTGAQHHPTARIGACCKHKGSSAAILLNIIK